MGKKIIDISQPLTNTMGKWPGDTPFTFNLTWTKEQTGSVNIGQIQTSLHTGTHIDAPFHFDQDGKQVHELDLNNYIGRAKVVEFIGVQTITKRLLEELHLEGIQRLLFKTTEKNSTHFKEQFPLLTKEAVEYLSEVGVQLIGIDAPSVDAVDSKDLPIHHELQKQNISILENIMLGHVPAGDYELIALPLAIVGADGSPVRAVLREL